MIKSNISNYDCYDDYDKHDIVNKTSCPSQKSKTITVQDNLAA